jgi:peptide/nickel transport system substrate-binding protein
MRACGVAIALVAVAGAGCKRAPAGREGAAAAGTGAAPALGAATAATAATIVTCTPAGCPSEAATGPISDGGELVMWVDAEPAILNDLVEHDAWSRWILENQVIETLLQQDPWNGAIRPRLAEQHELTADALTLHLRRNVKWHDGQPFTAADVAFTINMARDPKVGADQRSDFEPVSALETPDDATVILRLARPAPFLRQALAHLGILPAHLYKGRDLRRAEAARAPVGTGPFKFVSWLPGDAIVLERFADYWGDKPHLQRVRFRVVRDKLAAWELYRRGELDVLYNVPPARFDEAQRDAQLVSHHLFTWTPPAYFFIAWNTERGRLGDARVRRALTMLIDRDRFDRVAFNGHARRITGPFAPGTPSYDASIKPWPYDPAAAKQLLADAGVKSMKLTFLATAGSRTVEQLATMMKEDFARAGITLDVATVDFAVQLDRLRHHAFDASALQWTIAARDADVYDLYHSSQAANGQNYGAWKSPAADALLDQIRHSADDAARHALEQQLHRLIHDEQPYTFLSMREVETLEAPRVHALAPSPDGFDFARAWVTPR